MPSSRKYRPMSSSSLPKRQRMSMQADGDLPAVNYKQVVAARRLQRVWRSTFRHLTTKTFVVRFLDQEVGLPIDKVKTISFEALVVYLRDKSTIAIAKDCLQRIHLLSAFRHGSVSNETVNVRVFLAAFMIAFRPTHVFESMGALEKDLLEASVLLLTNFQRILDCVVRTGSADHTEGFLGVLFEYLKRFKAWKVPDEAKLSCRIKNALIALYQADGHLGPDESDDSKLRVEFRTQITRLRLKLQQIAGVAELAKFDADGVPGIMVGVKGCGAVSSGRMTNEQLAHELLLDNAFQLDDNGSCTVEHPVLHRISGSFHQAFWNSVVDDLNITPPCYVRVLRVLSEVRDGILDLSGVRESVAISEAIDIDFIKDQAELGIFDWMACKSLVGAVVGIIRRLQAPKRDSETQAKWLVVGASMLAAESADRPRVMCKALEFMLDRVNVMRIDAANARLRLIAPVIREHGVCYERAKFQDKLNDGTLTLERTQARIETAVRRGMTAQTITLSDLVAGQARAFLAVHTLAIFTIIADPIVVTVETVPETLIFDVGRLSVIQRKFSYIVDGATMLLSAAQAVNGSGDRALVGSVLADLAEMLVADDPDFDSIIVSFCEKLDAANLLTNPSVRAKLLNTLSSAIGNKNDAVRGLVMLRVGTAWIDYMITAAPIVGTKFLPALHQFIPLIESAAGKLNALASVNRNVHLGTYNRLIAEAAAGVA